MNLFPRVLFLVLVVLCLGLGASLATPGGDEWRAIDKAELESKTPVVDKDADARCSFGRPRRRSFRKTSTRPFRARSSIIICSEDF
jgi:hypothetical protein